MFALDAEGTSSDGEWPVVEVTDRGVDRVGTSLLRFLHVLAIELAAAATSGVGMGTDADAGPAPVAFPRRGVLPARSRAWPITGWSWRRSRKKRVTTPRWMRRLASAVRAATPPTPALLFAVGMRAALHKDWASSARAFEDAIALEPLTMRDDDARLDAAAAALVLAIDRGDAAAVAAARRVLADGAAATAAFWRVEALHALGAEPAEANLPEVLLRIDLGLRIVAALAPGDPDLARVKEPRSADADDRPALAAAGARGAGDGAARRCGARGEAGRRADSRSWASPGRCWRRP